MMNTQGERDYSQIKGQTGPLVYPAGFLYIYTLLAQLTQGGNIILGQMIFTILYLLNQALVMSLYIQSEAVPPWALTLLCLSKRVHSIFILRMFNDSITMMLAYTACLLLIKRKWRWSVFVFSAALSVKMNVLLMAPPVLVIMLQVGLALLCFALPCLYISSNQQQAQQTVTIRSSLAMFASCPCHALHTQLLQAAYQAINVIVKTTTKPQASHS